MKIGDDPFFFERFERKQGPPVTRQGVERFAGGGIDLFGAGFGATVANIVH